MWYGLHFHCNWRLKALGTSDFLAHILQGGYRLRTDASFPAYWNLLVLNCRPMLLSLFCCWGLPLSPASMLSQYFVVCQLLRRDIITFWWIIQLRSPCVAIYWCIYKNLQLKRCFFLEKYMCALTSSQWRSVVSPNDYLSSTLDRHFWVFLVQIDGRLNCCIRALKL